ncbi:hypothetical protein KBD08_04630, partial [Candidatus Babeliales bacterium]|nr:hypothetical protein [Candidatus Babeliales bacterium]
PMGAGLVMGDMMLEGLVEDCQIYSNIGHSGHSYGVLLDKGYSITLQNNTIAGNAANVHGIAAGILDVTAHTPNLYIRNTLEGNKCSIFNNSNYFIPFNSADANNLAFPVNKIKNGSFTNPTTDYDNTVIEYSLNSQFYQYDFVTTIPLHPDLRSYLSSTNCWN